MVASCKKAGVASGIGGMFGVLISLGIYFAFDWGRAIVDAATRTLAPDQSLGLFQSVLRRLIWPYKAAERPNTMADSL